jgi:hypothetical protein
MSFFLPNCHVPTTNILVFMPAAHNSYMLSKKLLVPVSSAYSLQFAFYCRVLCLMKHFLIYHIKHVWYFAGGIKLSSEFSVCFWFCGHGFVQWKVCVTCQTCTFDISKQHMKVCVNNSIYASWFHIWMLFVHSFIKHQAKKSVHASHLLKFAS